MTEDEARRVHRALELVGVPGEAGPVDMADPAGEWRIFDRADALDRQDITLSSLDALIAKLGGEPARTPGWHDGHPVRGFIFPEHPTS
ncbi:MAG: hypothetical protein ACRDP3_05800 [Streptomyces sp.]|uniref:hypothetical protein n=1 Tax=Streptomyces sp. TaxID=1931 RepID=UPI003D6B4674